MGKEMRDKLGAGIYIYTAAAAKSLQSCPTLRDPIDGSPPGSPVPGILQARTLEWVAISFSNAWNWKVKVKSLRRVWPSATPWTVAYQAPPSMGFSRQEYWSGLPLPCTHKVMYYMETDGVTCYLRLPSVSLGVPFLFVGFSIQQGQPLQLRSGNVVSDNWGLNPREVFNWPPKLSIQLWTDQSE